MKKFYQACGRAGVLLAVLAMLPGLVSAPALAERITAAWPDGAEMADSAAASAAGLPGVSQTAEAMEAKPESAVTFTFTDSGVTASDESAGGFSIDGTELLVNAAGVYTVTGACSEGTVAVKKGTTGVTLILENLTLACSSSAPLVCRKSTGVTLYLSGTNVLTDNENPEDENSEDEAVADAFEGAAIKVKSEGASLSITGDGTLTADGSNCKNGVKAGAESTVTVDGGTLLINAANNGLAADGAVIIRGGVVDIDADGDGIKASPDDGDTVSAGTVTIYGGEIAINAGDDGINAAGEIAIHGGAFTLDTADDAIHSDTYVTITGGTFTISAGDDGIHADTSLILGTAGGRERDPDIAINRSYEGLEAGTVYIYSGRHYVIASDDGINAAGGSGSGSDPGGGGDDHFNPGGGGPGGRMMGGLSGARLSASGDYSLNIMGGNVYVNADGDGLDANGDIAITGGKVEVWGQSSGDNEPLDYDGTLSITGGTVFAAGNAGMGVASPSGGSQGYISNAASSFGGGFRPGGGGTSGSFSSGSIIAILNGAAAAYHARAPKAVSYVFFSSPSASSSWTISTASAIHCALGSSWTHSWNDGVITTAAAEAESGVLTYTCGSCGAAETKTIPATGRAAGGGNTVTVNGTSAAVCLNLSGQAVSAGNYALIVAFYDGSGKMIAADMADPVALDSALSATVSDLACPESFASCAAFLLDSGGCPICERTALSAANA